MSRPVLNLPIRFLVFGLFLLTIMGDTTPKRIIVGNLGDFPVKFTAVYNQRGQTDIITKELSNIDPSNKGILNIPDDVTEITIEAFAKWKTGRMNRIFTESYSKFGIPLYGDNCILISKTSLDAEYAFVPCYKVDTLNLQQQQ